MQNVTDADVYEGRSTVMKHFSILMIVVLVCASADAATITQTWSQATTPANWTKTFVMAQFDTSLGTLNSVTLSLGDSLAQTLMYENLNGPGTITFEIAGVSKTGCDFVLKFTGGSTLLADAIDNTPTYSYTAYDGVMDFGGTSGGTYLINLSQLAGSLYTGAGMSPFIGTGSLSFDAVATGRSAYRMTGGNGAVGVMTSAGANVTLVYDYTPVPEPATFGLLSLGGLILARRRR